MELRTRSPAVWMPGAEVVPIQSTVLPLCGLISGESDGNEAPTASRVFGGALLIGGWSHLLAFYSSGFLMQLIEKLTSDNKGRFSPLVYVVQNSVYIAMNIRALITLTIFYLDPSLLLKLFAGLKRLHFLLAVVGV
ncbi:hypothetical protein BV898_17681 [Hypsibius exemplaris]|uniref:Uncharacterized protein n=1 Tax=Hypsibius exemplaris TaxID=2072580 RepID=A0A9X6NMN8_HYPEX|nr:hypothetical protein BV898_17681 [Hypsibius exemplaris]